MTTLITKKFNLGDLLIVSEVQCLIFMMRNSVGLQAYIVLELRMLHIAATGNQLKVTLRDA